MSNDATQAGAATLAAPDFAARVAGHPGPDDRPWWTLWVSAYALPALYTAWKVGLFDACAQRPCSIEDIADRCELSPRTARILLHLLTSRELLEVSGERFTASASALRHFAAGDGAAAWGDWLTGHYDKPVTPERLLRWLSGDDEIAFPQLPDDAGAAETALQAAAWAFPAAVVADQLGLFALLTDKGAQTQTLNAALQRLAAARPGSVDRLDVERLQTLLPPLHAAGVLADAGDAGLPALTSAFAPFLDPSSCYYKGGTLRLMELAPPCAAQAWEALATERAAAESRMDETIKSPDLSETYAFALHMDAQGAGADAAWACSGLIGSDDRMLDLAGGGGSYAICAALQVAGVRCMLLEQDPMTEVARQWISQAGVEGKVDVVTGDMFQLSAVETIRAFAPTVVFASNIFHDWRPEDNLRIAQQVHATLPAGGRFILHEMPLAENGHGEAIAAGFSETLRVWTEGTQYRLSELQQVLKEAGFEASRHADSLGPYLFIAGVKPG